MFPPPRLHILHLLSRFEPGGVSRYVLTLNEGLCAAGHRVTVVGDRGDWSAHFENGPARTLHLPLATTPFNPLPLWRGARRIERALDAQPIDLIHAHHRRASLLGRRLARRRGVPLLFSLHMPTIPMGPPWRWLSDFGDHTLTASGEARDWLVQAANLDPHHISVIPHGISPDHFPEADESARRIARRALGLPEDAPVAAFVGRLEAPKQPQWTLDVAAAAKRRLPELHVIIMGGGPKESSLRQRIAREALADRVHIVQPGGPGEPQAVYQAYTACDLLLLPSRVEAFALVCAEAMSVGRAVLRTRTGGWRTQIVEHHTGRSVHIDRQAFTDTALAMLADRPALHRMGAAAAAHAREHLRFDRQLDATINLYRQLIAHRATKRATTRSTLS